ncbi:hypothetical protein H634G_07609 [Metarhizium anisopliae BRIP 53293]|uniref:BTB domain-containing protein n=1 Tax=Metarhizium anisopliae BRIP 53293 TaxID=1291518 RepID=A0A0D9NTG3_METAN|nr:hypothetical protein H634G_07609 [Metarhizium anisopliae BRIP 53293]KJK87209.1 hypothetical protein H633G_08939 [Metarhizium anisopliae BRIP 53284]
MKSEMGEDQEIVLVPSGTVLIEHTPSGKPFAPWGQQGGQGDDDNGESDKQGTKGNTAKFTERCSSDILRLVSPMLNTSLDRRWVGWKESGPDNQGIRHVELKGFDSVALHYVLNILHHQADLNPERLTVEGLAKMAVIVHHLGCHQAFVPVSKLWAADYQGLPKSGFSRDVVLWLLVSTVFAMRPIFDSAATMAIKEATGPLDTLGLPIEERVVGEWSEAIVFSMLCIFCLKMRGAKTNSWVAQRW